MADPRFFDKAAPKKLAELAGLAGAELASGADPDRLIEDVAPLEQAGQADMTFLDNVRYKGALGATRAGACILSREMAGSAPADVSLLISETPYKAYALIAQAFYPFQIPPARIAEGAMTGQGVKIGQGCRIDPGAVIQDGAVLGAGCWIESGAVIGRNVEIGKGCRVGMNASLSHALVGDNVHFYPGVRIGQDGFGFAIDPKGHVKVPQLGRVVIGDHVEIGANTTIDRGSGPDTVIGSGTWIDNLVQIAHNVSIGRGCVIVAQVGIAGSTVVEDYAVIAAQTGVAGHLTIGKGARIGAKSGVMRDIPPGTEHMGIPTQPKRRFMRQVALLKRLTNAEKNA